MVPLHNRIANYLLDARVKIVFTLVYIILLNLTPSRAWAGYILFFAIVFSAILLSRLGIGFVFKRALLAIPFALAAVPLVFTGPLAHPSLIAFGNFTVVYSPAGMDRFISITLKSWMSVQAAILLTATTPVSDILAAMQELKAPKIFIAIIGLMWRYLFVIREEVTTMIRARASRSASRMGSTRAGGTLIWRARVTGSMAGNLFLRSLERSDRVYAAMLSRGYNGESPKTQVKPYLSQDRYYLTAGVIFLFLAWIFGWLAAG